MDYSKWTDFAINAAVGAATGEAKNSEPLLKLVIRNSNGRRYDPCNNPADAWPIIVGNAIGVMPFKKGESEAWSLSAGLLGNTTVKDKNPLRAAMIVYLMMQESE